MLINEVYTLIKDFTRLALNDPTISIMFGNPDGTRAKKPLIVINIDNIKQVDREIKVSTSSEGIQTLCLQKTMLVTFNCYSDYIHDAITKLNILENSLYTQLAYDVFRANISAMRTLLGVNDISTKVGAVTESRAILQVEFMTNQLIESNTGIIETVNVQQI